MTDSKLKITHEVRPLSALKPDPKNARRHPEQQIARIAGSIEKFGYITKIACQPDGTIIGGHATKLALERLGMDKIEVCVVSGLTEPQYRALGLALNKIAEGSSWDESVLGDVISELQDGDEDLGALGFSDNEIKRLLDGAGELEVKEIETGDVEDEFWISVRGSLKDQAAVLKALEQVMAKFTEVTVDLGTIAIGA
jgi:ParB-like chromosome segregation protein Spo0J